MSDAASARAGPGPRDGRMHWGEPARTREQEALMALLRSADLAKHRFSGLFDSEGITFQQYNVLRILRRSGPDGLPTLEVGQRMIERTPGVTRIIDRLQGKGLVQRQRSARDRRRVWCRISPRGLDLLQRLDAPVRHIDGTLFEGMEAGELDALFRHLEGLRERLAAVES